MRCTSRSQPSAAVPRLPSLSLRAVSLNNNSTSNSNSNRNTSNNSNSDNNNINMIPYTGAQKVVLK